MSKATIDGETLNDGDIVVKNGKRYKLSLEEIPINYGPLGSELVRFGNLAPGEQCILIATTYADRPGFDGLYTSSHRTALLNGAKDYTAIPREALVERIVSGQIPGAPLSAAEAAKIPGINGRFVAMQVVAVDINKDDSNPLAIKSNPGGGRDHYRWIGARDEVILLPENFGKQFK